MGDYNIDLLKDDSDRPTHDYLDFIYSYCIIPSILKPTRITETSATIIDNILTNCDNELATAILVTDITDHFPTILINRTKCVSSKKKSDNEKRFVYKRNYTDDNISHFKQKLSQLNWDDVLHGSDANCDYNNFINKFKELHDQCIPLRKCNVNKRQVPQSPWITKGMLKSIQNKNKLYKEYLQCPNDNRAIKFNTYRNKLNNLIRKSKREYFYSKFRNSRNNIKETWKTINSIIGRVTKVSTQSNFKTDDAENITEPKNISNAFNNFFVDIGPKLASKIQHTGKNYFDYLIKPAQTCIFTKPIVPEEIVKIIGKFNPNKQLKIAKVIPIYKKENAEVLSNYRPVSVLPCFSKILERLMFNRCMDYIDKNDILNEKQFGFRSNHSTNMAIIELVDKVTKAVEKK